MPRWVKEPGRSLNRPALVIGAGRIGCGPTQVLLEAGRDVILADQDEGASLGCSNYSHLPYAQINGRSSEDLGWLFDELREREMTPSLVFSTIGGADKRDTTTTPFWELPLEEAVAIAGELYERNALAFLKLLHTYVRVVKQEMTHGATLIGIGSVNGGPGPNFGQPLYSAAKAGLHRVVEVLGGQLAVIDPPIVVAAIAPGTVRSPSADGSGRRNKDLQLPAGSSLDPLAIGQMVRAIELMGVAASGKVFSLGNLQTDFPTGWDAFHPEVVREGLGANIARARS